MTLPSVSIVIPSWNGRRLLERFIPSVLAAAQRYLQAGAPSAQIIVVDDGSTDDSVGWLLSQGFCRDEAQGPVHSHGDQQGPVHQVRAGIPARNPVDVETRLLTNEKNLGFGVACNRGFAVARNKLVLLLNNDVDIDADCISPLVENFSDGNVFAAHCHVIDLRTGKVCGTGKLGGFAKGFIRVHRSYVSKPSGTAQGSLLPALYSMFASGGSAMFDRDKFIEIGGFEDLLSPFYWEDVELCYRAWKRGYSVLYEPRAIARHAISSTIGALDRRKVQRVQQRNRLIFHWIHLQDRRMMLSHMIWLVVIILTAPLRLQTGIWVSAADAVRLLPRVRDRRREEKNHAKRSDKEVFHVFGQLARREDLIAYDRPSELGQSELNE
jgi:GT2 family glycosyltransferase